MCEGSEINIIHLFAIHDLHKAIKFSKVHHFADDTNLFIKDASLKKLKK